MPDDGPRIGELFAGYAGLGMGVRAVLGGNITWFSELDEAPSKVLAYRYPGVPNHGDITRINWSAVEPVDILTGGSPCQDLSQAGKRRGMTEGTRSNLWVAMREAIAELRPSLVVWENVRGAYSAAADSEMEQCPRCVGSPRDRGPVLRALGRVLGDLSDLGYVGGWHGLRAADVGAPHGRFRVFVVAHPNGLRRGEGWSSAPREARGASADIAGRGMLPTPRATRGGSSTETVGLLLPTSRAREPGSTSDGHGYGLSLNEAVGCGNGRIQDLGIYAAAIARWEALTRPAPPPAQPSRRGTPQLSPAFSEWMMGLPEGHVTGVPGLSRGDMLKILGNGVVPQQAEAALRFLLAHDVESTTKGRLA
mgnify:CR=1 FL=1